jgi:bifunctional non-homologous end joining protein LigD
VRGDFEKDIYLPMRSLLKEYTSKREFEKTPEPKPAQGTVPDLRTEPVSRCGSPRRVAPTSTGEVVESGLSRDKRYRLIFVVHKHAARALHYDLRLELEGVLKSWAVPKGPSLDPSLKRLAVLVEDHPLDYKDFEGVIPEGNYGAGSVILWDRGFYHHPSVRDENGNEKLLLEGFRKGNMKFVLEGEKLHGEFALVKTRKDGKSWLLLKKKDRNATKGDILKENRSVVSQKTLEEMLEADRWSSAGRDRGISASRQRDEILSKGARLKAVAGVEGSKSFRQKKLNQIRLHEAAESEEMQDASIKPMPHAIQPMLATLVKEPFDHPDWIYEVKWDGYRAVAEIRDDGVSLYSRNLISFDKKFSPIVNSLRKLRFDAVLDGEIVVVDDQGRPDFEMLQHYQDSRSGHLLYYVFDLLYFRGHDLTDLPLLRRKELLKKILPATPKIRFSDHVWKEGVLFYNAAKEKGLEGIIAKHSQSVYEVGRRSRQWLKVKTQLAQEAVIAGFTEPGGGRKHFGALVLGVYEGDELMYIGHVGGGFTANNLKDIREKLEPLIQKESPFTVKPETNAPATWVKPELVCEVALSGWTEDGVMRHPVFLRLREDKAAREVVREKPLGSGSGEVNG